MRILHVVAYFPPDGVGGIGQGLSRLHAELLAAGHESTVLTAGTTTTDPTVVRIARSPMGFLLALATHARRAREYDLVHCRHGDALPMLIAMKLFRIPTPVLATFHVGHRGMADSFRPYRIERQTFGREWAGWKYRHVIARFHRATDWLSRHLATDCSFISRYGAVEHLGPDAGATATVIYNAVPDWSAEPDAVRPAPADLLYVGTFSHRKRVLALPFILRHVRREIPDARLRLVGAGMESQLQLRDLFTRLDLSDAVVWEGTLRSEEIRPYYRAAKVLVVPSAFEGLPTVILEAFHCGLPCVATRVSGHPEVVDDGQTGFLVDLDRPDQLAERCIRILRDEDLQARMGRAAVGVIAERFTLPRQVAEYLALYRKVCRPREPPRIRTDSTSHSV